MQSENFEHLCENLAPPTNRNSTIILHHGVSYDASTATALLSHFEEHGSTSHSGSEWSFSTSGRSPSESHDNWLDSAGAISPIDVDFNEDIVKSQRPNQGSSTTSKKVTKPRSGFSLLQNFPEELLFHVISHLSADDLLTVKLVSRQFYDLVNSPHAWINAFSRYFPGADHVSRAADSIAVDSTVHGLKSERRCFTRLQATVSWTAEYLLRTKLLRCLARGKPSIPFAAPSPGKSNKGFATFTYGSRLKFGVSHLSAKFGPVLDKRLPQFIHGLSNNGTVSSSDRRGKFDGWGFIDRIMFQEFSELYPGTAPWGLGSGDVVGVPNVMDLSAAHGMIYGEGTPGGQVYYLGNGEKHGRYLASFSNTARHDIGMPKVAQDLHCICSVWIAKTAIVPRLTKGLVGLLSGSSCGILSAYSVGSVGDRLQRLERGELTARWVLSPGVPIIGISVDENYSEARVAQRRVWVTVLNALGEVFVLTDIPQWDLRSTSNSAMEPELAAEIRSWELGRSVVWSVLEPTQRSEKFVRSDAEPSPSYYGHATRKPEKLDRHSLNLHDVETLLSKRPFDIRSDFENWDMRRRLEVDFAGDDGKGAGETILVISCGLQENQQATLLKYTRCAIYKTDTSQTNVKNPIKSTSSTKDTILVSPSWSFSNTNASRDLSRSRTMEITIDHSTENSFEWRCSRLSFGRHKSVMVSTTTIDSSIYATTTCAEDIALRNPRNHDQNMPGKVEFVPSVDDASPLKMPGQRARFVAAGTSSGIIFIWDARAIPPSAAGIVNDVKPIRIIFTDSPEVTSLALSALYLVHGGSEGLVQAWDPLASSLQPIRTISSRNTLNARRRAVIAAQQNPTIQVQMLINSYAATAICLDPDPTVLRGIVAVGSHLRYWAYSSTAATDDISKSQKRKINRVARGLDSNSSEGFLGTRRISLKGFVHQEVAQRAIEEKERRAEQKEERRLACRFGLNLLGHDASEEELLAYAKLLSEEDQEKHATQTMEGRLAKNATDTEIETFMETLSEEDRERWRFASWEERFEMPLSGTNTVLRGTPTLTPAEYSDDVDKDLARAIKLSLNDHPNVPSPQQSSDAGSSAVRSVRSKESVSTMDDDLAEAIRLSLGGSSQAQNSFTSDISLSPYNADFHVEDDVAKAIRLSLLDQKQFSHAEDFAQISQEGEFPPLVTPSSGSSSPMPSVGRRRGKGKARGPAVWER